MREIKFRGKDKRTGLWHYGFFWKSFDAFFIREKANNSGTPDFEVIPESVGEFTGLKDKNGKEIYEGDVMYQAGIGICEVKFINGAFGLSLGEDFTAFCEDYEKDIIERVIGNIYENPELLEESKKK